MPIRQWFLALAFVGLAGCTGSTDTASNSEAATETATPAITETSVALDTGSETSPSDPEDDPITVSTSTTVPAGSVPLEAEPEPDAEVGPVQAYANDQPVTAGEADETSAWVSRRSMSAESIEMVWSAPEGAAEYQMHRVRSLSDSEPELSDMNAENLIHTGEEKGVFVDTTVEENEIYWYGVRGVDAGGVVLSVGWHRAAAVTDEEPPAQVELSIEQTNGSVLVLWNEPAENHQLHGYRILRAVGDSEAETVATTWNLDQMSFVDDEPPEAVVTYFVVAFDFHWNDSEPAEITIDLS